MSVSGEEMTAEADTVTTIGRSLIQHGSLNDRIYLMKLAAEDLPSILEALEKLGREMGYSKIFAKVPSYARDAFLRAGYKVEASVPGLYSGEETGYFMARFLDPDRESVVDAGIIDDVRAVAASRSQGCAPCRIPPDFILREADTDDAEEIASIYRSVFESYPFPIRDPAYIREMMAGHVRYFCVEAEGRIVAVASSEMDISSRNVEMTDFATNPAYRGMGLCSSLLQHMEDEMKERGICTAYTIARAASYPINITFARAGYTWGGTLVNNTNICGGFESMNVWHKKLAGA
jgi:putative beta-lysine N-acetyltransferase